jgi:hypothetical protein
MAPETIITLARDGNPGDGSPVTQHTQFLPGLQKKVIIHRLMGIMAGVACIDRHGSMKVLTRKFFFFMTNKADILL